MSFSSCKQCGEMVAMYQKYCCGCVKKFPVLQCYDYWKLPIVERELHDKVENKLHSLNCDGSIYNGFIVLMNIAKEFECVCNNDGPCLYHKNEQIKKEGGEV